MVSGAGRLPREPRAQIGWIRGLTVGFLPQSVRARVIRNFRLFALSPPFQWAGIFEGLEGSAWGVWGCRPCHMLRPQHGCCIPQGLTGLSAVRVEQLPVLLVELT
jgi:hypothetical protein